MLRVDPALDRAAQTIRLGGAPRAVAAGADGAWVAVAGDRRRPAADAGAGAAVARALPADVYRGPGRPDRLIVTDLPLQGGVRLSGQQMAQAAAFVLSRARLSGRRPARRHPVVRRLDRAHRAVRSGTLRRERASVRAPTARVIGVIGTLNSPCAAAALPELARAQGGPLAMVSPAASYAGLTRRRRARRPASSARSTPAAAGTSRASTRATTTRRSRSRVWRATSARARVAALDDGDLLYGSALADRFARAARALGVTVATRRSWDPEAGGYARLAAAVARARPDAVFLGGILDGTGLRSSARCGARCRTTARSSLGDGFTPTRS